MNSKLKNDLLDIAADLVVSPIAVYVQAALLKKKFDETETGIKTRERIQKAGADISETAKKVSESETAKKIKETAQKAGNDISETAKKIAESETAQKAKEGFDTLKEKTISSVKDLSGKVNEKAGTALDNIQAAKAEAEAAKAAEEASAEEPAETQGEEVKDIIDGLDFKVDPVEEENGEVVSVKISDDYSEDISRSLNKIFGEDADN